MNRRWLRATTPLPSDPFFKAPFGTVGQPPLLTIAAYLLSAACISAGPLAASIGSTTSVEKITVSVTALPEATGSASCAEGALLPRRPLLLSFRFLMSACISSDGSAFGAGASTSDTLRITARETPITLEKNNLPAEPKFKMHCCLIAALRRASFGPWARLIPDLSTCTSPGATRQNFAPDSTGGVSPPKSGKNRY